MNWLLKLIFTSLAQFMVGMVDTMGNYINNIFDGMYQINQYLGIDSLQDYLTKTGFTLVSIYAIKQGIQVYVLQSEGDPDSDPLELLTRVAEAVAVIICGPFIIQWLVSFASQFSNEVLSKLTLPQDSMVDGIINNINVLTSNTGISSLLLLIFLLIILIALVIFIVKAAKRAAEIMVFGLLLPFYALDLLTTSRERWNAFFTDLMITIFGYIVQLGAYSIFMLLFAKVTVDIYAVDYIIACFGWLFFVLSAPKWIQKFSYTSGAGNTAKGAARTGVMMIPQIIRIGAK